MDKVKFAVVFLIIGVAIGGFYYYEEQSLLYRVVGLLMAAGVATVVLLQTVAGRQAWAFFGDAKTEARKVVWPTNKETMQTTLIVMVMVLLVAILLWLFDMFLTWAVQLLTGQGSL